MGKSMGDQAQTYKVKHRGEVVGEIPNTGDAIVDSAAALKLLKEKGLHVPTTTFQAMFRQAHSFCTTASYLYKNDLQSHRTNVHSIAPFVVNATFAIEVYLKAIATAHKHSLRGHELVKLFDSLPPEAIVEIEAHSPAAAAGHKVPPERSFRDCLSLVNGAFIEWRYLYEKTSTDEVRLNEVIYLLDTLHHACSAHANS